MEGLLGVTLLRELQQSLAQFQVKQKPERGANATPDRVAELAETLRRHEEDQRTLRSDRTRWDTELNEAKARRQDLMNRTMALGGGSGDIATVKEIMEEKGLLKQEREKVEAELAKLLADRLPFHLMRQDLRNALIAQWMAELERGRWENRRTSMEPDRRRFVENFFGLREPVLAPGLTGGQEATVRERIELAWQGLFYPIPEGCAEQIVHGWIHDQKRDEALKQFNKLRVGGQTVLKTVARVMDLRERESELDQRLTRVEGIDRDGTLAQIKGELVELNARIEQAEHELGGINRQLTALDATVAQDRAAYEREHEKLVQTSPALSNIGKAERVRRLIGDLIPRLYELKTKHLSEAMTRVFGRLAHTPWFDRILVDNMGRSTLFSADGVEVSFDRLAGENQIFVTALLAGLAEVSGIRAPLVVDTPLGRLDVTHRENILDFWLSDEGRQVILLSQDAEIGQALLERLRPAIAKTFLLHHEVIGQGVGKTVAYEDRYFDFEASLA
jgi:DNA sulfur modification protein DndD